MLAELLLDLGQPDKALVEFEAAQKTDPSRLQGLAGAARAADQSGDRERAKRYYAALLALAKSADSDRLELKQAKAYLGQ